MIEYSVDQGKLTAGPRCIIYPVFPADSIMLGRTPFTLNYVQWDEFFSLCGQIKSQLSTPKYVFVNATWDPIRPDNEEIVQRRLELQAIFSESKVVVLSAHAQHFYDNLPGIIYFPFFTLCNYHDLPVMPRRGRFGCLNRRPAIHRIRLMYHALDQGLLDASKDVFSVSFASIHHGNLYNFYGSGYEWMEREIEKLPRQIATHPDGFPCDYSICHPAWHTGITVITETEPGDRTIICEKTGKGIISRSCFSVYMAEVGYCVLEDLGFEPRFFADHAEYENIEPLLRIFREFETESQALDYRQQHIQQVNHNFDWFGIDQPDFWRRPWYVKYEPKLKDGLASL